MELQRDVGHEESLFGTFECEIGDMGDLESRFGPFGDGVTVGAT
jgi:hypothetical protein